MQVTFFPIAKLVFLVGCLRGILPSWLRICAHGGCTCMEDFVAMVSLYGLHSWVCRVRCGMIRLGRRIFYPNAKIIACHTLDGWMCLCKRG